MIPSQVTELRLLVGYLGEAGQQGWWRSNFLAPYAANSLNFIAARTVPLAQLNGVSAAATLSHDQGLPAGSFHLFRLPEGLEYETHQFMVAQGGKSWTAPVTAEDATGRLAMIAGGTNLVTREGPLRLGGRDDIYRPSTAATLAAAYLDGFKAGRRVVPYFGG